MPPQPRASRPELGAARRIASFSMAARAGFVAWVCRPRRLLCRCLCHFTPKAHSDVPAVKQAIELVRKRKIREATEIEKSVREPMAQKLIEWVILRSEESGAGFDRYAAFIRDAVAVRRFLDGKPTSATGRLALARVLLSEGNRSAAEREVQETWQSEELSAKLETEVLAAFPDFVTRADHVVRMDRRVGAKDFVAAMRAAVRLGGPNASIVKACAGVMTKGRGDARTLLEKVPGEVRQDLGYTLCRIHWLLRNNGVAE